MSKVDRWYVVEVINENEPDNICYFIGTGSDYYPEVTVDINNATLMPRGVAEYAEGQVNSFPDLRGRKLKVDVEVKIHG